MHPRAFQHLSRARSPVNARAWRGREGGDVSSSRAKLVFCLGSQILNFHSRARTRFGRPLFFFIRFLLIPFNEALKTAWNVPDSKTERKLQLQLSASIWNPYVF